MMFNFICKGKDKNNFVYTIAPASDGLDDFAFAMGWRIIDTVAGPTASMLINSLPMEDDQDEYIPYESWKESLRNTRYEDAYESESWRS